MVPLTRNTVATPYLYSLWATHINHCNIATGHHSAFYCLMIHLWHWTWHIRNRNGRLIYWQWEKSWWPIKAGLPAFKKNLHVRANCGVRGHTTHWIFVYANWSAKMTLIKRKVLFDVSAMLRSLKKLCLSWMLSNLSEISSHTGRVYIIIKIILWYTVQ